MSSQSVSFGNNRIKVIRIWVRFGYISFASLNVNMSKSAKYCALYILFRQEKKILSNAHSVSNKQMGWCVHTLNV